MQKILVKKINQDGFTLIEILAGLALIGIICMGIIPLFTNSFKGIMTSAAMSKTNYEGQAAMENILAGENPDEINGSTQTYSTITIKFPGTSDMVVNGNLITIPLTYKSQTDRLTSFIP